MSKFKAIPITYLGKPLHQVYPHATRWQVLKYKFFKAVRWFLIRAGIGAIAVALLFTGYFYHSVTTPNLNVINTIQVVAKNEVAPILHKICMAESGCQQFAKNGLPIMHANSNGSVDIGKYQINSAAWGTKAKALGYDLLSEKGNEAMATWILENKGSGPWYSSEQNWN